jgi:DNA invertase Pin-like site-specific DNA recombinase
MNRQGIKAARKAGKYLGRKTVINKKLIDEVKYLKGLLLKWPN